MPHIAGHTVRTGVSTPCSGMLTIKQSSVTSGDELICSHLASLSALLLQSGTVRLFLVAVDVVGGEELVPVVL